MVLNLFQSGTHYNDDKNKSGNIDGEKQQQQQRQRQQQQQHDFLK